MLAELVPAMFRGPGLSDRELRVAQEEAETDFPPDLCELLSTTLPTGTKFPDWRGATRRAMAAWRERLVDSFLFDLTENDFWHPLWGEPPGDCENARAIVARHLADAPPLIPIYAHRAIPNEPLAAGNPVFSVWQAVDTIVYGVDLGDYLRREFHRGAELAESCRPIRFWTSVVDPSSPAV